MYITFLNVMKRITL